MIDAGFRGTSELVMGELSKLTEKKVKYIINTHYNGDHTGGNLAVSNGATIIAQQACRDILLMSPNYPIGGISAIIFQDSVKIYFNGEEMVLRYLPGHTSSDIVIQFKNSNIVFLGDLVFSNMLPLIQPDGSYEQLEKSIYQLSTMFSADTRFFPSHGVEISRKDLTIYLDMVQKTKSIVLKAIKDGKLPDEAKKENILKDWQAWDSKLLSSLQAGNWIDNLYSSLDEGKETSALFVLKREYQKSGLNAMMDLYKKIAEPKSRKNYFIESDFNVWGYELVAAQKLPDALEVFKINTEIFPESWNAFDSLGEAYLLAGNKELAIKNFEKSLELNPQNTNAVEQLKKIKTN